MLSVLKHPLDLKKLMVSSTKIQNVSYFALAANGKGNDLPFPFIVPSPRPLINGNNRGGGTLPPTCKTARNSSASLVKSKLLLIKMGNFTNPEDEVKRPPF